jgi:hypothetical protein
MTDDTELIRPTRPASVELAAAILVVGGAIQLLLGITTLAGVPPGAEGFVAIALALNVATIATGVLIRSGRAWLVGVNVAAILGFLDLLGAGGSPLQLMLGAAEVVVVAILFARKPWFDAMASWRVAKAARGARRLSP